jgi:hypothetical protein
VERFPNLYSKDDEHNTEVDKSTILKYRALNIYEKRPHKWWDLFNIITDFDITKHLQIYNLPIIWNCAIADEKVKLRKIRYGSTDSGI